MRKKWGTEMSRDTAFVLSHTQTDADATPQLTYGGPLMSSATVILPTVQ